MAYKQKNINFGEGTGSSPNKIKKLLSPKWIAAEGYYKAYQNYKENKQKKKEIKEHNEMLENRKAWEKHISDPNVDPREKIQPHATYGQVQVWDEKLGRKRWVQDMDAYYKQKEKEGLDPVTLLPLKDEEERKAKIEEEKKQSELAEKLKISEEQKQKNFSDQIHFHGEIVDKTGTKNTYTWEGDNMLENGQGGGINEPKNQKIPAVGTEARKKYYDSKKWKYDDTIKGYNKDGSKKEVNVEQTNSVDDKLPPEEKVNTVKEKKDTSDPFGGDGEPKEKKDKKKFKDTKVGKFLGVGQGNKKKKKKNKKFRYNI